MEAIHSSVDSDFTRHTLCHIPEDVILHCPTFRLHKELAIIRAADVFESSPGIRPVFALDFLDIILALQSNIFLLDFLNF
jgi:hypothetical protein